MKKTSLLMPLTLLASISLGLTSCMDNDANANLDDYEILEVGEKKDVQVAQFGSLFCTAVVQSYGQKEIDGYVDQNSFIFVGTNVLNKRESELFAKKYSYTADFEDKATSFNVGHSKYTTYCKREKKEVSYVSFRVDEERGSTCCLGYLADVMEYKLTPKDSSKGVITIYGFTGPLLLTLIYSNL